MGSKSKAKNTQQQSTTSMNNLQAKNPKQTFGDVYANSQTMMNDMIGSVTDPFMDLIARGEETMSNNIMLPIMEALGIQAVGGQGAEQAPDAYEARIQELMSTRGMSREQAVANQSSAMNQGTDFNNDGAVTNNEWAQFQQTPEGAAHAQQMAQQQQAPQQPQQAPQQPMGQPQAGVMPAPPMQQQQQPQPGMQQTGQTGQPQTRPGALSPEAQAAIAKWNQQGGGYV
jgi:hypothetical protein